jgi:hypothetical protein
MEAVAVALNGAEEWRVADGGADGGARENGESRSSKKGRPTRARRASSTTGRFLWRVKGSWWCIGGVRRLNVHEAAASVMERGGTSCLL